LLPLLGLADLHQELARLGKLQDHVVVVIARCGLLAFRRPQRPHPFVRRHARHRQPRFPERTPVAADPDVALVVDEDSVVRLGPVVAFAGTAPGADEVACFIELENRRRRLAALRLDHTSPPFWTGRIGSVVVLHGFERGLSMHDPDMVIGIHADADRIANQPVVGQRLRPHGIHLESRRHYGRSLHPGHSVQHKRGNSEC
jgi:hypothetical protein